MKKTKYAALWMIGISAVFLFVILGVFLIYQQTHRIGIPVLSQEKLQAQMAGKKQITFDGSLLRLEGAYECPYDQKSNTVYMAQSLKQTKWTGKLTLAEGTSYRLYLQEDPYWEQKAEAIRQCHEFTLYYISETEYAVSKMQFSGGAIISLVGIDNDSISRIQVINPNAEDPSERILESYCMFHPRGNMSKIFPKKAYKVELCTAAGEQVKQNLLGLREDDDWNLNALYTDSLNCRDIVGCDVWKMISDYERSPFNCIQMAFAEVLVNHQYQGLYGLSLPIDRKLFNMDDDDSAYTYVANPVPDAAMFYADSHTTQMIGGAEMKIEPTAISMKEAWEPFATYMQAVYWGGGKASSTEYFNTMNLDNVLSYELGVQIIGGVDNFVKNAHYLAYRGEDGDVEIYKYLFDLNYTFGDIWVDDPSVRWTATTVRPDWMSATWDMGALLKCDEELIKRTMVEKWYAYQEAGINAETICNLFDTYMEQIVDSGAMQRDTQRWPQCNNTQDTTWIKQWVTERFAFLDAYYADMAEELGVG